MAGKKHTVDIIQEIVAPVSDEMGLMIWDIRFEKEGPNWFLRIFIDKDGGVDINDCENFSRKIDKLIDEADPIDQSYFLEVSSPGIERELTKDWHFNKYIGSKIDVKLIRPIENLKNFTGKLTGFEDNTVKVLVEENEISFNKKEAANIKLHYECD